MVTFHKSRGARALTPLSRCGGTGQIYCGRRTDVAVHLYPRVALRALSVRRTGRERSGPARLIPSWLPFCHVNALLCMSTLCVDLYPTPNGVPSSNWPAILGITIELANNGSGECDSITALSTGFIFSCAVFPGLPFHI